MEPTRAPECNQHRIPGIRPFLHRHGTKCPLHVRIDDLDDALRNSLDHEADPIADHLEGSAARNGIEVDGSPQGEGRRNVAEYQVRVSHGRLGPAPAIGGWARIGSC